MISCAVSSFGFAAWPAFAPLGVDTYVNGTCDPGFQAANPAQPPQRLCPSAGTYTSVLNNPCIRT